MDIPIAEVKNNITYHRRSIRWLGVGVWLIVLLALMAHVVITSMMDQEINRLASVINMAIQSGVTDAPKDPKALAYAGRDNNMGWLVLSMFFVTLLAMLGKLRFHLKEMSLNEARMYDLVTLQAVGSGETDAEIKRQVINASFSSANNNEPVLNIGTETIVKISDAVVEKMKQIGTKS
jgi:beta-lactamase regulating signal transducer with metallopeptidase domain